MARPKELYQANVDSARVWLDDRSNIGIHTLLPTIEGLALHLGISRDTVYAWEEDGLQDDATDVQIQFSDIVKELRAAQAEKLMQNSLQGRYNPMISKLLLSKHGYVEKQETDITTKGDKVSAPVDANMLTQFLMNVQDNTKR